MLGVVASLSLQKAQSTLAGFRNLEPLVKARDESVFL